MSASFNNKYDKTNILLRRDEVKRLSDQGLTETEIGQRLGISQSCVSLDLQYLECKAAERMKEHIEKTIPSMHSMCEDGLRQVLKKAWTFTSGELKPSELTQRLALIAELYEKIYNLSTERPTLKIAMEIVQREKERLRILEQKYGEEGKELTEEEIDTKELQESIEKLEEDMEEEGEEGDVIEETTT